MQLITISDETKKCMAMLPAGYEALSEMAPSEQKFLVELILQHKPKKVLEVGIAAGSSSVLMLQALQYLKHEFSFHSVDYYEKYYRNKLKNSGFLLEFYPTLLEKRNLYTGGYVYNFLHTIGHDIDFCLIDTKHSLPGELLDFIMVLPYLKKNALIVLHDTNLHALHLPNHLCNNLLISALSGTKYVQKDYENTYYLEVEKLSCKKYFPNISAVKLADNQQENIWDVFNLLTQKWLYLPNHNDLQVFQTCLTKHYDNYLQEYFKKVVIYQQNRLSESH